MKKVNRHIAVKHLKQVLGHGRNSQDVQESLSVRLHTGCHLYQNY